MVGFGMILAGAAQGWSEGRLSQVKAEREQRLKELEEQRQDRRLTEDREFRSKEAAIGRDFEAGQADKTRQQQRALAEQEQRQGGDLITLDDGTSGVRFGSTVRPLTLDGQPVRRRSETTRVLTAAEKTDLGLSSEKAYQVDKDGKISQIGGGDTTINVGDQKLTEGQSKDLGFFSRGLGANDDLNRLEDELTSIPGNIAGRFGVPGNFYKDPEYRQAERAGREVLAVILRKDTGAAVTQQEFELYGPMYLPWPGDDMQTIRDKRKARSRAIDAMEKGLGTARPLAREIREEFEVEREAERAGSSKATKKAPPRIGTEEGGYRFMGGNPADPNSWERMY